MHYVSTRGEAPSLSFTKVLTSSLASDGGLYVPEQYPQFTPEEIASWRELPYTELVLKVISPFIGDAIPAHTLRELIEKSYASFRHPEKAPLHLLEDNTYILELFHGPTIAFKDFALQLLGNLLNYILEKNNEQVVILGATSGDTGSAAIAGCLGCERIQLFMLHPYGRVSDVQRRQMTTVNAPNIHNLAIEGTFDDCQAMVKQLFRTQGFLERKKLVAVNSINWARIMAQIVYYFSSALHLGGPAISMAYSVPTGNFGDIFAGYVAHKMGLPIHQLIIATNRNDILHRFLTDNDYSRGNVFHTYSPSMDIQVSSNLERLLFDAYGRDGHAVRQLIEHFQSTGAMVIDDNVLSQIRKLFDSAACEDARTVEVIRDTYTKTGYHLDPHTATAVDAAYKVRRDISKPMVILATAHPAKFPDVSKAAIGKVAPLPEHMEQMMHAEEHFTHLSGNVAEVQEFITQTCQSS
ncbi:MAG: threonine synthase [Hyphomicrobiales bacterium]|nr:threonine synthase [Hyphomicrobiales bacterium]